MLRRQKHVLSQSTTPLRGFVLSRQTCSAGNDYATELSGEGGFTIRGLKLIAYRVVACHQALRLATRAPIYRSLCALRARNRTKSLDQSFFGVCKKVPERVLKTLLGLFFRLFRVFLGTFFLFCGPSKKTLFETSVAISGPKTLVKGRSGRNSGLVADMYLHPQNRRRKVHKA